MSGRTPESPGLPERTGSHPDNFAPHPFATRDMPYPPRNMDEITDWMPRPHVEPRGHRSEPITPREWVAVGEPDRPTNWTAYWAENQRGPTAWRGYDNSQFRIFGGREDPNETAAVANDQVMQSIEPESDPLVALRQANENSQRTIREGLEDRVDLEDIIRGLRDSNRDLRTRFDTVQRANDNLVRSQRRAQIDLASAQSERDQFRRERDLIQNQEAQLRRQLNEPEAERGHRLAQQTALTEALQRERDLSDRNRALEQSESNLEASLDAMTERGTHLQR